TGYLKMDVSMEPTQQILNQIWLGSNHISMIINNEGTIIAHPAANKITTSADDKIIHRIKGSSNGSFYQQDTRDLVVYRTISDTQWKMVLIVPHDDVAGSIQNIRNITMIIAIISLIVAISMVIVVSSSVTRRLQQL